MELNTIQPADGAKHYKRRVGRGIGSGIGKTAGRGHKGQKSRTGGFHKVGFEGGQMPLQRRVPKVGFKNPNRVEYAGVNLDVLQELTEKHSLTTINFATIIEHGLASKNDLVKILGRGELKAKLEVTAHAFTVTAQKAIEAAGGTIVKL